MSGNHCHSSVVFADCKKVKMFSFSSLGILSHITSLTNLTVKLGILEYLQHWWEENFSFKTLLSLDVYYIHLLLTPESFRVEAANSVMVQIPCIFWIVHRRIVYFALLLL